MCLRLCEIFILNLTVLKISWKSCFEYVAVVVAQMAQQSPLKPEIRGSNPTIGTIGIYSRNPLTSFREIVIHTFSYMNYCYSSICTKIHSVEFIEKKVKNNRQRQLFVLLWSKPFSKINSAKIWTIWNLSEFESEQRISFKHKRFQDVNFAKIY